MNRYIKAFILTIIFVFVANSFVFGSIGIEDEVRAYLLGDFETGRILEGYNIDEAIEIASISKLMSYLIVMEHIERGKIRLEDQVYIDKDVTRIKGSSLKLEEGELFTIKELLEASLVVSANDATYALAKYVAGSEEEFVKMMNHKAQSLGFKTAYFINSTGLPEGNRQNKMSTVDIFNLSRYIINRFPEILSLTAIPYIQLEHRDYKEENTNPLLKEIRGVDGLKTGFTNKAGYCLVATINNKGDGIEKEDLRLISIVMGTESYEKRKELSQKLLEYGLHNYSKRILAKENMPIDFIHIPKSKDEIVELYPSRNYSTIVKRGERIKREVVIDEDLPLPLKAMDRVGEVIISKDGKVLDTIELVVHKDVEKANIFVRIFRFIARFVGKIFNKIAYN